MYVFQIKGRMSQGKRLSYGTWSNERTSKCESCSLLDHISIFSRFHFNCYGKQCMLQAFSISNTRLLGTSQRATVSLRSFFKFWLSVSSGCVRVHSLTPLLHYAIRQISRIQTNIHLRCSMQMNYLASSCVCATSRIVIVCCTDPNASPSTALLNLLA